MFTIVVNKEQLIKTLERKKSLAAQFIRTDSEDSVDTLLKECRFFIVCNNEDKAATVSKIEEMGKDYFMWLANGNVAFANDTSGVECNPFKMILDEEYETLFDIPDIKGLLFEKELLIKKGGYEKKIGLSRVFGEISNEILLYDPYFLTNREISISTLKYLINLIEATHISKILIITCPTTRTRGALDTEIENFFSILKENNLKKNQVNLLVIGKTYHDRDFISNQIRIKSGGSFDFLKKGETRFSNKNAMTMDFKSLFLSSRYEATWKIVQVLFESCRLKYRGNNTASGKECEAAEGFENSLFYRYWLQYQ
ncbi:MAG: hypothetical protein JST67_09000 [Bacteroidetes bacterium]|nr:hypothetical protein [Bacteroidota bacterium]